MDARPRRWLFGIMPFALAATGCSLFDRSTDRLVHEELREAKQSIRRPKSDPLGSFPTVGGTTAGPATDGVTTTVRPQAPVTPGLVPADTPPLGPPVVRPVSNSSPQPVTAIANGPIAPPPLVPLPPTTQSQSSPIVSPQRLATPGLSPQATPTSSPSSSTLLPIEARSRTGAETRVKVVATVGPDGLITDEDVLLMMRQRARDYLTLSGRDRDVKEKEVYCEELRRLIERELIISEFLGKVRKNKPQLVDELWEEAGRIADRQIRDIRRGSGLTNEAEFAQMLEAQGMTAKGFRRQLERTALSNMYMSQYMREKTRTIGISQVHDYYRQHADMFRVEDRVKWQHFFVSARRFNTPEEAKMYAEWALKTLQAGADFTKFAREYGHGDSALRGGEGSGQKRGEIQPIELESVVFGLAAGKTSELIPTSTGYHIVRVLERDTAGVRPLDEKLQAEIRGRISDQSFKQDRDKLVTDLWRKTTVTVVGE